MTPVAPGDGLTERAGPNVVLREDLSRATLDGESSAEEKREARSDNGGSGGNHASRFGARLTPTHCMLRGFGAHPGG